MHTIEYISKGKTGKIIKKANLTIDVMKVRDDRQQKYNQKY